MAKEGLAFKQRRWKAILQFWAKWVKIVQYCILWAFFGENRPDLTVLRLSFDRVPILVTTLIWSQRMFNLVIFWLWNGCFCLKNGVFRPKIAKSQVFHNILFGVCLGWDRMLRKRNVWDVKIRTEGASAHSKWSTGELSLGWWFSVCVDAGTYISRFGSFYVWPEGVLFEPASRTLYEELKLYLWVDGSYALLGMVHIQGFGIWHLQAWKWRCVSRMPLSTYLPADLATWWVALIRFLKNAFRGVWRRGVYYGLPDSSNETGCILGRGGKREMEPVRIKRGTAGINWNHQAAGSCQPAGTPRELLYLKL